MLHLRAPSPRPVVLNQGQLCAQGTSDSAIRHCGWWGEAEGDAVYPTIHPTCPTLHLAPVSAHFSQLITSKRYLNLYSKDLSLGVLIQQMGMLKAALPLVITLTVEPLDHLLSLEVSSCLSQVSGNLSD